MTLTGHSMKGPVGHEGLGLMTRLHNMKRHEVRGDRGATLVEFAIVAPLLFMLLFGVIEFARLISAYTTVWTGAREGARYATTSGESDVTPGVPRFRDCAGIIDAVQAKAITTSINTSDIIIEWLDGSGNVIADCDDADSTYPNPSTQTAGSWDVDIPNGTVISVEADGTFNSVMPFIGDFLSNISLNSTQTRSIYEGIIGG
jgi:Flp pilus assembly protein TadG